MRDYINLGIIVLLAVVFWYIPVPSGLTEHAWHLFIIFIATIVAIIFKPLPLGALITLSISSACLTGVLTIQDALSAYGKPIVWLILFAFFIAQALTLTGLGQRISYHILARFGRSPLGLAYSFVLTDLILAPAIPSNTARGGGIIYPIIRSLINAFDGNRVTPDKKGALGPFLIKSAFQANIITSTMFLTAIAGNPFAADFAAQQGIELSWGKWALAGSLPGLICLALIPVIIYPFLKPEKLESVDARQMAKKELGHMGPMDQKQKILSFIFAGLLLMWAGGASYGIHATLAAMIGIVLLVMAKVISWDDMIKEKSAWNTFVWFGALIMYAHEISKSGIIDWFGAGVADLVATQSPVMAFVIISAVYFYTHYFFASTTALISTMFGVFLAVLINKGIDGFQAAMTLAAFSCLSSCITHYGTGSAPVYFGGNYLTVKTWWKIGFVLGLFYIVVWWGVGSLWWQLLGLGTSPFLMG
ncbi:MAG: anion permease [Alphaproteobacteria bacterium]|mgnify:CR=1 FL=1|nr:MAG: anion permease [Alphaproteobacteria bacterium]